MPTVSAFVIETATTPARYWDGQAPDFFTDDDLLAIRFARAIDATRMLGELATTHVGRVSVQSHDWEE